MLKSYVVAVDVRGVYIFRYENGKIYYDNDIIKKEDTV